MSKKITRAVIPAAGLGTRFLPATKTIPKEMLTIVDAPIIFYVVEEAIKAGIEDIILIQGRNKESIEDFFDTTYELEDKLEKSKKFDLLDRMLKIRNMANLISIRQKQPLGLGHAIWCSKKVVGDNPFAVLLGDEIMIADKDQLTSIETLSRRFEETQKTTVAVMKVDDKDVSKYGIAETNEIQTGYFKVNGFIEKPKPTQTKSRWALPGRYVFDPKIFDYLSNAKPGLNGEIQLTDSMNELSKSDDVFASSFECTRYDAGDKLGYLTANIELALRNPELKNDFKNYLLSLTEGLKSGSSNLFSFLVVLLSVMMMDFLVSSWTGFNSANAFIPNTRFILHKTAENNGNGIYQIEQEVTFSNAQDQISVKETWLVESDESMKLLVQGLKDAKGESAKDLMQLNFIYKQDQRLGLGFSGATTKKTDYEFFEKWFHYRSSERFLKNLIDAKITTEDAVKINSPKTIKDISNETDANLRLSRVGGVITYGIGVPVAANAAASVNSLSNNSAGNLASATTATGAGITTDLNGGNLLNPGLWIEQDVFQIRKIRLPSTAEIIAEKHSQFSRGLVFPRHRIIKWGPNTVTISVLSITGKNKDSWNQFPTKFPLKKDRLKESSLDPVVEDFYERFR